MLASSLWLRTANTGIPLPPTSLSVRGNSSWTGHTRELAGPRASSSFPEKVAQGASVAFVRVRQPFGV